MPTGLCETGVASPLLRPADREARLRRPCERFTASRRDAMADQLCEDGERMA